MYVMLGDFKEIRKSLGLSQVELASLSGVSLPTIQNIEAGKANPSLDVLLKLLDALGLRLKIECPFFDVENAVALGVPLSLEGVKVKPTKELLLSEARKWVHLFKNDVFSERESLAVTSFLCAIKDHYPTFYSEISCQVFDEMISQLRRNGHLIKLRRIAISKLAKYL
jgi:transcriptional regulator with XRE-family HTH domain